MNTIEEDAVGKQVQYYYEGLRVGTIRAVMPKTVEIEPMGGKQRKRKKHLVVSKEDVVNFVDQIK